LDSIVARALLVAAFIDSIGTKRTNSIGRWMLSIKALRVAPNGDSVCLTRSATEDRAMMGRQRRDQGKLFYEFRLEDRIPENHLLRRINVFVTTVLADLHKGLESFYSDIGRPSVDPELMIRMLVVGYCYGIRSERRLTQEVELHLAYRWFCKLDLDDEIPHHSTFSLNRLGRFKDSDGSRRLCRPVK
jgi:transposase